MDDPRRVLETAAEERVGCEVLPRQGAWARGTVIRVERGGLVLLLPGTPPPAGTDVRCWLAVQGQPWTFEASVLRTGVPVPDRSQGGVLLGFVDGFRRADRRASEFRLEVLPATGGPVSLVEGDVRVVDLHPQEWTVSAPRAFRIVFAHGGRVRLRLGLPERAPMEVDARVETLSAGESHLLYGLRIESIEDAERYRELIAAMREALGL